MSPVQHAEEQHDQRPALGLSLRQVGPQGENQAVDEGQKFALMGHDGGAAVLGKVGQLIQQDLLVRLSSDVDLHQGVCEPPNFFRRRRFQGVDLAGRLDQDEDVRIHHVE